MTAFDSVIVRIDTDDGIEGFGESIPLFRSETSNPTSVARMINGPIRESLLGEDPFDIEKIVERMLELSNDNVDVPAGIDPALWDIVGKSLGQPVFMLMGGLCLDPIPVDHTIGGSEPDAMTKEARDAHQKGFRGVVVKVDAKSLVKDVQRVKSVRESLPSDCTVRVDCNGAFSREGAIEFLRRIADMNIELVEQPVHADDLEGSRRCRDVGIPISVDESVLTLEDALRVVTHDACDIMNIKVPRVGGLLLAKRMASIAAAACVPIIVGGRTALQLSRYTSRHFAASTPGSVGRKHEGPGPVSQALRDDVVTTWTAQKDGTVRVERSPGMGYDVVWEKVERYAVRA
jgi:L-alanine-DL-glutamate epimerase-like enolase superfamily enzyme